jgi:hypothetical protein
VSQGIKYFVEPSADNPSLLYRIAVSPYLVQGMSRNRPQWYDSPTAIDMLWSDRGISVDEDKAGVIARSWGASVG